jgi:hypothetical protein
VFLLIPQWTFRGVIGDFSKEDNITKFRLIGIDTGHKADYLRINQAGAWLELDQMAVQHPSDVAIVAPIWKVTDLLEREDVAAERREQGLRLHTLRGHEIAVSDEASPQ